MVTDRPEVEAGLASGSLGAQPADWSMHLGCCATDAERQAAELVLGMELLTCQAARIMGCTARDVRIRLDRFLAKVKRCENSEDSGGKSPQIRPH